MSVAATFVSASTEFLQKINPTGLPSGSSAWTMEGWIKFTSSQTEEIF